MELYLNKRKIKKYLNTYLRKLHGQRIRVHLCTQAPDPTTPIGWACYDPKFLRADYYVRTMVGGRKQTVEKHLSKSEIRNILADIFMDYRIISMKLTSPDYLSETNGVSLDLEEKEQYFCGPVRRYVPKRREF